MGLLSLLISLCVLLAAGMVALAIRAGRNRPELDAADLDLGPDIDLERDRERDRALAGEALAGDSEFERRLDAIPAPPRQRRRAPAPLERATPAVDDAERVGAMRPPTARAPVPAAPPEPWPAPADAPVRDRRRGGKDAWLPRGARAAGAAAAAILALVLIGATTLALRSGSDDSAAPPGNEPLAGATGASAPAQPARTPSATPASGQRASAAGDPYSESSVLAALQSRGLQVAPADDAVPCSNAGARPTTLRVTATDGEQRIALLVYPSAAAMNAEWAVEGGSPLRFRNGGTCFAGASVIYWNANLVLAVPQVTAASLVPQIAQAFLAVTP